MTKTRENMKAAVMEMLDKASEKEMDFIYYFLLYMNEQGIAAAADQEGNNGSSKGKKGF